MDPIFEALDKLRGELSKAIAAQKFRATFPDTTEPFRFADPESMVLEVYALAKFSPERVLSVSLDDGDGMLCAHLSQEAVNALARYLDAHRTDVLEPLAPSRCDRVRLDDARCWLSTGHKGWHRYSRAVPSRCPSTSAGVGRCELNEGHLGTHKYCQHEWTGTDADTPSDAPREHWCGKDRDHAAHDHGPDDHRMHCLGSRDGLYGEAKSDACPSRYSNTGRDDDDQPCEKPVGHPRPHRAESEKAAYVWTDYNPRAYMADDETPEGGEDRG